MGTVSFSGAGTGIDWSVIIEAEIAARTRSVITPLAKWKGTWETKLAVFDSLRTNLSNLRASAEAMNTPKELRSYAVQSSDTSALTASVTGSATPGAYRLEVNQLAQAEMELHGGLDDAATVVNNTGGALYFAYTYAGEHATVQVVSGSTLQELADLINNDPNNPGVTAYVLDDGSGGSTSHHLVLRGADTGQTYAIAIDAAGTTLAGDWGDLTADAGTGSSAVTVDDVTPFARYQAILIDDDDSAAEYHIIDSIAGSVLNLRGTLGDDFTTAQNAYATPRGMGSGLAVAANSGDSQVTVDDATHFQVGKTVIIADGSNYEEVTISAVDTAANAITFTTTLANGYAADAYVTQLEGGRRFTFEDTDFSEAQAAQNAQVRLNGYPSGSWIERQTNVVNDLIQGVTLTLHGTTSGTPVAVTVNSDTEGVKGKIEAFVDAYNAVRTFLNARTSYNAESGQAGALLGNYAAELVESLLRDIVSGPAPGFLDGTDPYTLLAQVGLHTLGRTDDESTLGTIEVNEEELDAALAEDFEGVIRLFADDFSGYSGSSYLTFYQASSSLTTPGTYDVEADFDAGGDLIAGRMKLSTESAFRSATVDSPYLTGTSGNPEHGLWVRCAWDGNSTTQSAAVRVTQGVAGRLTDALDQVLDTTEGLLHNIDQSYKDIIGQIDDRIAQEQDRLELLRERLTAKYGRLEQLLVQLQGLESWATQLASNMQQQS